MKDRSLAMILAALPGLFWILGMGHLYAEKVRQGVLFLIAGLILLALVISSIALGVVAETEMSQLPWDRETYERMDKRWRAGEQSWVLEQRLKPYWDLQRQITVSGVTFIVSGIVYLITWVLSIFSAGWACERKR